VQARSLIGMLIPLNAQVNCEGEVDSLPTVAVGVLRHCRLSSFTERRDLTQTVAPMGLGSVVGPLPGACSSEWSRQRHSSSCWG
jgi:hypothetical protein